VKGFKLMRMLYEYGYVRARHGAKGLREGFEKKYKRLGFSSLTVLTTSKSNMFVSLVDFQC
jgi:hypothetical protein